VTAEIAAEPVRPDDEFGFGLNDEPVVDVVETTEPVVEAECAADAAECAAEVVDSVETATDADVSDADVPDGAASTEGDAPASPDVADDAADDAETEDKKEDDGFGLGLI
jgi:hypothetical protein